MQSRRAMWGWLLKGANRRQNKRRHGVEPSCHFLGKVSKARMFGIGQYAYFC